MYKYIDVAIYLAILMVFSSLEEKPHGCIHYTLVHVQETSFHELIPGMDFPSQVYSVHFRQYYRVYHFPALRLTAGYLICLSDF